MKKLNELQEHSRWYINYTSIKKQTIKKENLKTIQWTKKQKAYFTKEIETLNK